eukprot:GHVT01053593.1.p3 GENE.GHVT01053593.1~~GHVT01053593.1.p3  ORF type:complete len:100 (-),score=13.11 GHVT01053593.1:14-313(-)
MAERGHEEDWGCQRHPKHGGDGRRHVAHGDSRNEVPAQAGPGRPPTAGARKALLLAVADVQFLMNEPHYIDPRPHLELLKFWIRRKLYFGEAMRRRPML